MIRLDTLATVAFEMLRLFSAAHTKRGLHRIPDLAEQAYPHHCYRGCPVLPLHCLNSSRNPPLLALTGRDQRSILALRRQNLGDRIQQLLGGEGLGQHAVHPQATGHVQAHVAARHGDDCEFGELAA